MSDVSMNAAQKLCQKAIDNVAQTLSKQFPQYPELGPKFKAICIEEAFDEMEVLLDDVAEGYEESVVIESLADVIEMKDEDQDHVCTAMHNALKNFDGSPPLQISSLRLENIDLQVDEKEIASMQKLMETQANSLKPEDVEDNDLVTVLTIGQKNNFSLLTCLLDTYARFRVLMYSKFFKELKGKSGKEHIKHIQKEMRKIAKHDTVAEFFRNCKGMKELQSKLLEKKKFEKMTEKLFESLKQDFESLKPHFESFDNKLIQSNLWNYEHVKAILESLITKLQKVYEEQEKHFPEPSLCHSGTYENAYDENHKKIKKQLENMKKEFANNPTFGKYKNVKKIFESLKSNIYKNENVSQQIFEKRIQTISKDISNEKKKLYEQIPEKKEDESKKEEKIREKREQEIREKISLLIPELDEKEKNQKMQQIQIQKKQKPLERDARIAFEELQLELKLTTYDKTYDKMNSLRASIVKDTLQYKTLKKELLNNTLQYKILTKLEKILYDHWKQYTTVKENMESLESTLITNKQYEDVKQQFESLKQQFESLKSSLSKHFQPLQLHLRTFHNVKQQFESSLQSVFRRGPAGAPLFMDPQRILFKINDSIKSYAIYYISILSAVNEILKSATYALPQQIDLWVIPKSVKSEYNDEDEINEIGNLDERLSEDNVDNLVKKHIKTNEVDPISKIFVDTYKEVVNEQKSKRTVFVIDRRKQSDNFNLYAFLPKTSQTIPSGYLHEAMFELSGRELVPSEKNKNNTIHSKTTDVNMFLLSIHIHAKNIVQAYWYFNGSYTRWFVNDMNEIWPQYFVEKDDDHINSIIKLINEHQKDIPLKDDNFDAFFESNTGKSSTEYSFHN